MRPIVTARLRAAGRPLGRTEQARGRRGRETDHHAIDDATDGGLMAGTGSGTETGAGDSGGSTERVALRRTLGFRDLVVYGLLFIAPMAPVGVFGTLDSKSGGAVALVYIAATVVMAFTAFSYAQMV